MTIRTFQAAFLSLLSAMMVAACSTKGPDLVDPQSSLRRQVVLLGREENTTGGELLLYSEEKGTISTSTYAAANNGQALPDRIDGIYENSGQIYLHHRQEGAITVLDMDTRKELAVIGEFPSGLEGSLCGMAFSNMSQGWVVAHGSPNLYELDLENLKVAHTYALPGSPTAVGTVKRSVFVAMKGMENSGQVAVFKSNARTIGIEKTLDFPSQIIYMFPTSDSTRCIMLSAGGNGTSPKIYYVNEATLEVEDEYELPIEDLTAYIGRQPNYAGYTRDDYFYLSTPSMVLQYDVQGFIERDLFIGSYPTIGVDYISGLLYAYDPARQAVLRLTFNEEELPEISVPSPLSFIKFLGSNRVVLP